MSLILNIIDSIARRLESSDFFKTVPQIPVVVEDHKDVEKSIERALQSAGAFCLVSFEGAEPTAGDSPGPFLDPVNFSVRVSEIPSVWRSKSNRAPSATMISEAVMRLIHHYQPLDENGNPIVGSVLLFNGVSVQPDDSFLIHNVTFQLQIVLSNESPTR